MIKSRKKLSDLVIGRLWAVPLLPITTTAHKLAKLVYRMLKYGMGYVDSAQQYYENQYRERAIKNLTKRAHEMGYAVVCTNTGESVSQEQAPGPTRQSQKS